MKIRTPISHPSLGGDVVDRNPYKKQEIPQRKPNKAISGEELLKKALKSSGKR